MITFKEYLGEGQAPGLDDDLPNLIDVIKRDCAPFLKQGGSKPLWRGMRSQSTSTALNVQVNGREIFLYTKLVRQDRKPLSTSTKMHAIIDDYFYEKFGLRARTQGVFGYGQEGRKYVEEFGEPYAVFPIGDFKYVWSPKVKDLTYNMWSLTSEQQKAADPAFMKEYLDSKKYKTNGLKAALKTDHEISVLCNKFYSLKAKDYDAFMKEFQ